jgi:hypothetical protein
MDNPDGVLRTGDRATVQFEFISQPEFVKVGMKLLFREGKTKVCGLLFRSLLHRRLPTSRDLVLSLVYYDRDCDALTSRQLESLLSGDGHPRSSPFIAVRRNQSPTGSSLQVWGACVF